MDKKEAELIISSWNGSDWCFTCHGQIYTEDDVRQAEDFLNGYS